VVRGLGRHVRLRRSRWCGEELAGTGKVIATTTAGEQAVVADAVKAPWQDVQQEPTDELVGPKRHGLVRSAPSRR
jgi:hypothetical protein